MRSPQRAGFMFDGEEYPDDPRPNRRTPYTSIGVHPQIRDALADIRDGDDKLFESYDDELFESYGDVICELIKIAQEDLQK